MDLPIEQDKGNVDVLIMSEAKLDITFMSAKLKIRGYASLFQLDRDYFHGGSMVFVREIAKLKAFVLNQICKTFCLIFFLQKQSLLKAFILDFISA